jgi:hypothetical protein
VTLIVGPTAGGKSTLASEIAACVSTGRALPGKAKPSPAHVLWLAYEESPARAVKPRLIAAGANLDAIAFPGWTREGHCERRFRLPSMLGELTQLASHYRPGLVVVDPIGSFLDADHSENAAQTARAIIEGLTLFADHFKLAVLVVKHPRKGVLGNPLERVSGSLEWVNTPRSILGVGPNPSVEGERLLVSMKHPIKLAPSLLFTIEDGKGAGCVQFLRETRMGAEDLGDLAGDVVSRASLAEAKELLRDRLEDGERRTKELLRLGEESGISAVTLRRAKEALCITSHPIGSNEDRFWVWRKPASWPG